MLRPTVPTAQEFTAETKEATYQHFERALWRAISQNRQRGLGLDHQPCQPLHRCVVGNEIGRFVTSIKLHTFNNF